MSVETNKLRGAGAVLEAVRAALTALTWNNAPAFERVEITDRSGWSAAANQLVLNANRAALVVYIGDSFNHHLETVILTGERVTRIAVALTDRTLGEDVKALTGNQTRPGTLGLLEVVLPALTGEILAPTESGGNSIFLVPTKVDRTDFPAGDPENFPGRSLLLLNFEAAGGWLQVGVGESNVR